MPTKPSRAANDLADRLVADGFEVSPQLVETWRSRGLLGRWTQLHSGGPGSRAVPTPDALDRARVAARLNTSQRVPSTVTLLAAAFGARVEVEDLRTGVAQVYQPILTALSRNETREPADRADAYVSMLASGRRGSDAIRTQAQKLAGSDDPQGPTLEDRSTIDRTHDALSAVLSALAGDSNWIAPVLTDALRLGDLDDVATLVDLESDSNAAVLGDQVAETLACMVKGLANLEGLSVEDMIAVQSIFATDNGMATFAQSTEPIPHSGNLTALIAGVVLSQLAEPGQLSDGLHAALHGTTNQDTDHLEWVAGPGVLR